MRKAYIITFLVLLLGFSSGCGSTSSSKVMIPELTENEKLFNGMNEYGKIFDFHIKDISKISLNVEVWENGKLIEESNILDDTESEEIKLLFKVDFEKDETESIVGFNWWFAKVEEGAILESHPTNYKSKDGKISSWSFEPGKNEVEKGIDLKPDSEYIISSLSFGLEDHGIQSIGIGEVTNEGLNSAGSIMNNDIVLVFRLKTGAKK